MRHNSSTASRHFALARSLSGLHWWATIHRLLQDMLHWHGLCRVWAMCNDRLLHHLQPTQYDPMHRQRLERYAPQRRHFQGFVVGVRQAFVWRQHARLPLHAVPAVGHGAYSCWDRVGAHVHWGLHCCSLGDQAHPGATFLRARSLSASHARTSRSWPRTSLLLPCEGPAAWVARVGVGGGGGGPGAWLAGWAVS